jgi:flagellar protein FliO/FliZ
MTAWIQQGPTRLSINIHTTFSRTASGLLLALLTVGAHAADAEAAGVSSAAIVQMLLGLAVIIGILFVAAYFLRKLNLGQHFGNSGPLRVVGGLMISSRERIILVEVGETWLVVGVVPGQIKTLHTLAKGEIPEARAEKPFAQWLKQLTEHKNAKQ